jgi:uncharacterized iron-regulated membrane protein
MIPQNTSPTGPRPRWLALARRWHKWGGVLAALFLLVSATTGIVLNYKKPIFTALGLERDARDAKPAPGHAPADELTTSRGLDGASVSFDQALAMAREQWGDVPLERVELKRERGVWLYKVKQRSGTELWINARTGDHFLKGPYERVVTSGGEAPPMRRTDWGKILLDLHTGKIGGGLGQAFMTLVAAGLLMLTISGIYMWLKPILLRKQASRRALPATRKTAPLEAAAAQSREAAMATRRQEIASVR